MIGVEQGVDKDRPVKDPETSDRNRRRCALSCGNAIRREFYHFGCRPDQPFSRWLGEKSGAGKIGIDQALFGMIGIGLFLDRIVFADIIVRAEPDIAGIVLTDSIN